MKIRRFCGFQFEFHIVSQSFDVCFRVIINKNECFIKARWSSQSKLLTFSVTRIIRGRVISFFLKRTAYHTLLVIAYHDCLLFTKVGLVKVIVCLGILLNRNSMILCL